SAPPGTTDSAVPMDIPGPLQRTLLPQQHVAVEADPAQHPPERRIVEIPAEVQQHAPLEVVAVPATGLLLLPCGLGGVDPLERLPDRPPIGAPGREVRIREAPEHPLEQGEPDGI